MTKSVNSAIYQAMHTVPTSQMHYILIAARGFCAARSGKPCPKLAGFINDPANESTAREVIQRIRDGTLLSDDNPVVESK